MDEFLKTHINKRVAKLPGGMSISEAMHALSLETDTYGVVMDENDTPVAVVTQDDLERAADSGAPFLMHPAAGFPPAFVIQGSSWEKELLSYRQTEDIESLLDAATRLGARVGVVIEQPGSISGIVQLADLRTAELASFDFGAAPGDSVLGGSIGASSSDPVLGGSGAGSSLVSTVTCGEPDCGFSNLVKRCYPGMPCSNPNMPKHVLMVNKVCRHQKCNYKNLVAYCDPPAICGNPNLPQHNLI